MLTPESFSQRPHFSRLALATSSSEAEAVSPMSLTGLDTASLLPGDTATASLSSDGEAFSSDCPHRWKRFGDWDVCADCEERRQHEITRESDLVRLARPPAPFGNAATDRLAGEANVGLQAVARNSSPVMGNTRGCRCTGAMTPRQSDPWAVGGKSGQPIFSPASDPPPMCDEENPTFGNNPNAPQDLT